MYTVRCVEIVLRRITICIQLRETNKRKTKKTMREKWLQKYAN